MRHKKTNAEGNLAAYQAMWKTPTATGDFHSYAYENGDPALLKRFQDEEKAGQERALAPITAAQAELNRTMIAALANELLTIPNDGFLAEHCPQTETANALEDIASAFLEFREMTLPTVITDAGIALLERITMQNLGVDWASTSPLSFAVLWARLESLGLVKEGTHYTAVRQPRQEPTPETLTDREQCEADWLSQLYSLFPAWEESLLKDFGIRLNDRQRRMVCDEFTRANLSPLCHESYNEIRRRMVRAKSFPLASNGLDALTVDESWAAAAEDFDFSDPRQKREWCLEMGRRRSLLPLEQ